MSEAGSGSGGAGVPGEERGIDAASGGAGSAPGAGAPGEPIAADDPRLVDANRRYWHANLAIMAGLLAVWAVVGLGCGVLLADVLHPYRLGGFPLGFWFAQQGSIVVFVLLILIYALALNALDNRHARELAAILSDTSPAEGERHHD